MHNAYAKLGVKPECHTHVHEDIACGDESPGVCYLIRGYPVGLVHSP